MRIQVETANLAPSFKKTHCFSKTLAAWQRKKIKANVKQIPLKVEKRQIMISIIQSDRKQILTLLATERVEHFLQHLPHKQFDQICVHTPLMQLSLQGPMEENQAITSFLRQASLQFSSLHTLPNAMSPVSIIEHLVLFKVRDSTDPSKIDAMVSSQRSLSSLDLVPHLAAGPIHRRRSPAANFTHLLHSRFLSKPDLSAYTIHPSHFAVVHQNAPIIEDVFSIDWVADFDGNIVPSPGSAIRFLIAKPREGTLAAEIVKAIDGVGSSKESWGVNFSQGRAKGYEVGLLWEFSGVEEMDGAKGEEEIKTIEERIRYLVDSIIVVDFVVPSLGL